MQTGPAGRVAVQADPIAGRACLAAFPGKHGWQPGILAGSLPCRFGTREPVALVLQWLVTVLSGGVIWFAWRDPETSFDRRAAVLLASIPLSSPCLW